MWRAKLEKRGAPGLFIYDKWWLATSTSPNLDLSEIYANRNKVFWQIFSTAVYEQRFSLDRSERDRSMQAARNDADMVLVTD